MGIENDSLKSEKTTGQRNQTPAITTIETAITSDNNNSSSTVVNKTNSIKSASSSSATLATAALALINNNNNNIIITKTMRNQRGGISESSTTSDNTTDFILIVKKHDIVYNTHHPDYKNVEVKLKVWQEIADEIGLSVDASKRKWKNLRDSYTKYLRSFRVGTKTSKKYQYWAHAEHMEFLKPYQGPGRSTTNSAGGGGGGGSSSNNNSILNAKDDDETESDLNFQVLNKITSNDDDAHQQQQQQKNVLCNTAANGANALANINTTMASILANYANSLTTTATAAGALNNLTSVGNSSTTGAIVLPVPSLPTVQLPPSLTAKPIMANHSANAAAAHSAASSLALASALTNSATFSLTPSSSMPCTSLSSAASSAISSFASAYNKTSLSAALSSSLASTASTLSSQFAMPQLAPKTHTVPMPSSNTASSVGCLIIEPQLLASAANTSTNSSSILSSAQIAAHGLQYYPNISAQVTPSSSSSSATLQQQQQQQQYQHQVSLNTAAAQQQTRLNSSIITKIRRVQPSPQSAAINLSFSSNQLPVQQNLSSFGSTNAFSALGAAATTASTLSAVPISTTSISNTNAPPPAKKCKNSDVDISSILQANRDLDANTLFFLSLARAVRTMPTKFQSLAKMRCMRIVSDIEMELDNLQNDTSNRNANKYCTNNRDSPLGSGGGLHMESQSEHFVYVMSPSRLENMIDLSSDEETTVLHQNGN